MIGYIMVQSKIASVGLGEGGVTVVENRVCAVLLLVASKRLNVNRMHFPLFTFGLF